MARRERWCRIARAAAVSLLGLALSACATVAERRDRAASLIQAAGWRAEVIPAGPFDLAAAWSGERGETLTVYLEGDGLAYLGRRRASLDPTPTDPVGLELALADLAQGPAAYLARPCQFVADPHRRGCAAEAWTTRRFAPEALAATDAALDALKRRSGASRLALVGYSGGGALAVLVAARRTDVIALVTVAANLDLGYWVRRDGYAPLEGSRDPADDAAAVASIPQVHFAGEKDGVVGPGVTRAFLARMPEPRRARMVEVPGFDHACCWAEGWARLQRDSGLPEPWPETVPPR